MIAEVVDCLIDLLKISVCDHFYSELKVKVLFVFVLHKDGLIIKFSPPFSLISPDHGTHGNILICRGIARTASYQKAMRHSQQQFSVEMYLLLCVFVCVCG